MRVDVDSTEPQDQQVAAASTPTPLTSTPIAPTATPEKTIATVPADAPADAPKEIPIVTAAPKDTLATADMTKETPTITAAPEALPTTIDAPEATPTVDAPEATAPTAVSDETLTTNDAILVSAHTTKNSTTNTTKERLSNPRRGFGVFAPNEIPTGRGRGNFGVDLVTKRVDTTVRFYKGVT